MNKIFAYLSPQELLTTRLVCKSFNQVIKKHPELLWSKLKILIADKKLRSKLDYQCMVKMVQLHCPNLHFQDVELIAISNFMKTHQNIVTKHLRISYVNYSVPNLSRILMTCPGLEYLELVGLPMERISGDKWPLFRKQPGISMSCLNTLVLSASSDSNTSGSRQLTNNISPGLLASLVHYATLLKIVKISGFSSWTCEHLVKILANDSNKFVNIKELVFIDIGQKNGPCKKILSRGKGFIPALSQLAYIQLRKLVIAFNKNVYLHQAEEDQDLFFEMVKVLKVFGDSLEELEIINVPVTEEIFHTTMPNLKQLNLDILVENENNLRLKIEEFMPTIQCFVMKNDFSDSISVYQQNVKLKEKFNGQEYDGEYEIYMQGLQNPSVKFNPPRLQIYKFMLLIILGLLLIQVISYIFPVKWRNSITVLLQVGVVFAHLLYKHLQWIQQNRC